MQGSDAAGGLIAELAWLLSQVFGVFIALLVAWILLLRARSSRRQRRHDRLRRTWEPLLAQSIDTVPPQLPALDRRDALAFFLLWNHLQESVLDSAKHGLNEIARRIGADEAAFHLVSHGNLSERLVALTALGHLRDRRPWDLLQTLSIAPDPVLSLCAAKALLRIDAEAAVPTLMPLLMGRTDWPRAMVASMLEEAGADVISGPLVEAVAATPPAQLPRVIRFLELAHRHASLPIVRRIIAESEHAEVVAACLRVFSDPADLDLVRERLDDERLPVRLNAAITLGRMGTATDRDRLTRTLADRDWWVRYRAAQSLTRLPTVDAIELHELALAHPDRYARDMLTQVIAEAELV